MYSIKPPKTKFKTYPDIKKVDRRKHIECHPGDPDAFRVMRVIDLDDGGYETYYEYWKPKKLK